ncbi:MAG TPA: hypothetical protein V6C78_21205 [Crinalium sp.]|jgi:hypothetical protein
MERKRLLWIIWLGFILYIVFLAPPIQPDTLQPITTLFSGELPYINPVIVSLFSLIGIWLLIYSCLVFADGRMQTVPAWAFMLASVGTGVIGLIPYLALREPNQEFSGQKDPWLALLDSRLTGNVLMISTLILLGYAIAFGDWAGFAYEFQTNRFIHGMSLAFCLFGLLFPYPTLLQDDMARRGWTSDSTLYRLIAWVPLFGPLLYLCLRPPLMELQFSS